jgi:hypothetical protein
MFIVAKILVTVISGYRRYVQVLLALEDGADTLSRNVGKQSPHGAA